MGLRGDHVDGKADNSYPGCCCGRAHLTDRQIQVLLAVTAGQTNGQAARALRISEHTVHRHVTTLLRTFGVVRRTGLLPLACRTGILVLGEQGPSWSGRRCLQGTPYHPSHNGTGRDRS
jgi:DNA-binding NarL/FixJ family response regulator